MADFPGRGQPRSAVGQPRTAVGPLAGSRIPRWDPGSCGPRIRVLGVGGAGVRAVARARRERFPGVVHLAMDADRRALDAGGAGHGLLLGPRSMLGLGCRGSLDYGRRACAESRDLLAGAVGDADLLLLLGGMGGGFGTVAAPFVARHAREAGVLTVAVVGRPFAFEGRARNRQAEAGLGDLVAACDTTIVVPGDDLAARLGPDTRFLDLLERLDEAVVGAAHTIARMATVPGRIQVDFADLRAVFQRGGTGGAGSGVARGPDRAAEAARRALDSPFLQAFDLASASGVLCQAAAADADRSELERVRSVLYANPGHDFAAVFGDAVEPALGGALRVNVVAVAGSAAR